MDKSRQLIVSTAKGHGKDCERPLLAVSKIFGVMLHSLLMAASALQMQTLVDQGADVTNCLEAPKGNRSFKSNCGHVSDG